MIYKEEVNVRRPFQISILFFILLFFPLLGTTSHADDNIYMKRLALYKKTAALSNVPWYYIAAVDQYERSMKTSLPEDEVISIIFQKETWFGIANPSPNLDSRVISLFHGIGKDGNGDGKADPNDAEDTLYTMATLLAANGIDDESIKITLWQYYKRDLTVKTIMNTAKVYKKFETNELLERDFPLATTHNYSYRNTWGDGRGFGGRRIHEGTDIFANYGTPVKSTTYGVVELKGWNVYGGWRIGIRDIHNIYHYYAHLNQYDEAIQVGDIVQPGDPLGTVGSSGYGPPGTAGKFPPHLHYGMYQDDGHFEHAFDPYPFLQGWERMAHQK